MQVTKWAGKVPYLLLLKCSIPLPEKTNLRGSITVWLTFSLFCFDSAALLILNEQQFYMLGQIQTSQIGQPFSDTFPRVEWSLPHPVVRVKVVAARRTRLAFIFDKLELNLTFGLLFKLNPPPELSIRFTKFWPLE